jgi:Flagellar protein FliT
MNEATRIDLQRVLQITIDMLDAAAGSNWDRVSQLDAERNRQLRKRESGPLTEHDREIIATVVKHNQTLKAHADAARSTLKQQLDQHPYNRRALQTYIRSSSSR